MHTERSGSMTVAIVFEDARIRQLSEEEKNEIEVVYQKIQENYGSLELCKVRTTSLTANEKFE